MPLSLEDCLGRHDFTCRTRLHRVRRQRVSSGRRSCAGERLGSSSRLRGTRRRALRFLCRGSGCGRPSRALLEVRRARARRSRRSRAGADGHGLWRVPCSGPLRRSRGSRSWSAGPARSPRFGREPKPPSRPGPRRRALRNFRRSGIRFGGRSRRWRSTLALVGFCARPSGAVLAPSAFLSPLRAKSVRRRASRDSAIALCRWISR